MHGFAKDKLFTKWRHAERYKLLFHVLVKDQQENDVTNYTNAFNPTE